MLIMESYDVKAFQVSGGPGWIATERWDILAKADGVDGQIPMAQMRPMLQAMIRDRFQLKVHSETQGHAGLRARARKEWIEACSP